MMAMVMLTEERYKNFSRNYKQKNYMQTIEYANVMKKNYKVVFLGL